MPLFLLSARSVTCVGGRDGLDRTSNLAGRLRLRSPDAREQAQRHIRAFTVTRSERPEAPIVIGPA